MKRLRSSQVKVRAVKSERSVIKISEQHSHSLDVESRVSLRLRLLSWYDVNKRDLPWRDLARHEDANIRAYSGIVVQTVSPLWLGTNSFINLLFFSLNYSSACV